MDGLTTYNALKSLTEDLKSTLESHHSTAWTFSRWRALLHKSILNTKQETSLFPWPSVALTILNILVLGGNGIQMKNVWLIIESVLLFVLLITNIFVNVYDQYLTEVEMLRKVQNVVLKLERHLGKKHALKKYDQFTLNTSCIWGSIYPNCAISRILCLKNNE